MFGISACECVCLLWPSNKPHTNQWFENKHCCSLEYLSAIWFYWSRLCCSPDLVWLCSCICNQLDGQLGVAWFRMASIVWITGDYGSAVLDLYVYMVAWADSHGRAGFQDRQKGKASWGLALRQTECHFHTLWSYPIDQSNSQDQFQFNGGQICPTS